MEVFIASLLGCIYSYLVCAKYSSGDFSVQTITAERLGDGN